MGVVAKSSDLTVGFDIAGTYIDPDISSIAKYLDVLVITHPHNDHLNKTVLQAAVDSGVNVIVSGEKVVIDKVVASSATSVGQTNIDKSESGTSLTEAIKTLFNIELPNIIALKSGESIDIKGSKITAIEAVHQDPNIAEPEIFTKTIVSWFMVEMSGKTLLHTGDGFTLPDNTLVKNKLIDLFMFHYADERSLEYYITQVTNIKAMVPLHLHELGHGKGIATYGLFKNALDQFSNGYMRLNGRGVTTESKYIPMMWGESIEL
jgi:mRNA degradation ribonuclease J1/J2